MGNMKPIPLSALPKIRGRNKYHAQKCGSYASRHEARRAAELKVMEHLKEISELREQVPYELIPAQYGEISDAKGNRKKTILEFPCRYIADFVYRDKAGELVVEDTKGVRTKEYIIKRKLMLHVHGIRIKEV